MTLSRPRTTGRVLRGSALGLGLLFAGGIGAPAALAIEGPLVDTVDETPDDETVQPVPLEETPDDSDVVLAESMSGDFGTGKQFHVSVDPQGPVPDDLDLSGAVFRATPVGPAAESDDVVDLRDDEPGYFECTTDVDGDCSFLGSFDERDIGLFLTSEGSDADVPAGQYVLTQVQASPGLALNAGSGTFTICASFLCGVGPYGAGEHVENDSLFRTSLVTTVTDVDTGAPIACAAYELTGPDYPHNGRTAPAGPADETVPAGCGATAVPTDEPADPSSSSPSSSSSSSTSSSSSSEDEGVDSGTAEDEEQGTDDDTAEDTQDDVVVDESVLQPFVRDDQSVSFGTRTSDGTGVLTFTGFFLPGDGYLLTPTRTPAGYAPDVTDTFGITTTAAQAASGEPAAVSRLLSGQLSGGNPGPDVSGGVAAGGAAAAAGTTSAGAATTTAPGAASAGTADAALATTGSPVGTMVLIGAGLVALGGGALATGTVTRRRARQRA